MHSLNIPSVGLVSICTTIQPFRDEKSALAPNSVNTVDFSPGSVKSPYMITDSLENSIWDLNKISIHVAFKTCNQKVKQTHLTHPPHIHAYTPLIHA